MSKSRTIKDGETLTDYLRAARRYARARLDAHNADDRYCHESHNVSKALDDVEARFVDLDTFGVEGDCELNGEGCIDIQYLDASETYAETLVYWRGRFHVASWGDCVELSEND